MERQFPERGEVWLVEFPDEAKSRPALIVSLDARNQFSNSVLAVPLTTNLRPAPTHVPLPKGQGGISQPSMARCENVSYIMRSRLRRGGFAGKISPALLQEIEKALMRSFGIAVP
ncbi:MAG TPA: type II toxin-antitoxin system PemK/MazF family toxin [Phycisphaerae bacterium]|nr:type II toxin-antitoxin system PemK/MazF family toxin [Phycisphaerae bacterium]